MLFLISLIYRTDSVLSLSYEVIFLFALLFGVAFVFLRRRAAQKNTCRARSTPSRTTPHLLILDRGQVVQNAYYPSDLGWIDLIERDDA